MSNKNDLGSEPEMRDEYDFSEGVRGKYADRFAKGSNVIILDWISLRPLSFLEGDSR